MLFSNLKFFIYYLILFPINVLKSNSISFFSRCSFSSLIRSSRIDSYSYIGPNSIVNFCHIKSFASIAPNCVIGGLEHSTESPGMSVFLCPPKARLTTYIEHDVWIGANSFICQGVTLGIGSVIGAGSVVLSDVPPFTIVAGVPAKLIRVRKIYSGVDICDVERCFSHKSKDLVRSCLRNLVS